MNQNITPFYVGQRVICNAAGEILVGNHNGSKITAPCPFQKNTIYQISKVISLFGTWFVEIYGYEDIYRYRIFSPVEDIKVSVMKFNQIEKVEERKEKPELIQPN